MKSLIIVATGCAILMGSTAYGQNLSERINHVMQKKAQQQRKDSSKARMLGTLLYTDLTVKFEETEARDALNYLNTVLGISIVGRYDDDRVGEGIDPETPITLDVTDKPALTVLEMVLGQCSDEIEQCTWQIRKGFVEVGTKSRLGSTRAQEVRYYPIRDLLFQVPMFNNAPSIDLDSALGQGQSGGGFGGSGGGSGGGGGGGGGLGGGGGGGSGGGGRGGGGSIFGEPGDEDERKSEAEMAQEILDLIQELVEPEGWTDLGGEWASLRYYQGTLIIRAPDFVHRQIDGYPFAIRPGTSLQYAGGQRYVTFSGAISEVEITEMAETGAAGETGG